MNDESRILLVDDEPDIAFAQYLKLVNETIKK